MHAHDHVKSKTQYIIQPISSPALDEYCAVHKNVIKYSFYDYKIYILNIIYCLNHLITIKIVCFIDAFKCNVYNL